MKTIGKVLSYILIGIVLLPIAAIVIYLSLGLALYLILYIYYRVKFGPIQNNKESKIYKNVGAVIIIIFIIGLFISGQTNLFSVQTWGLCNLAAFLGCLPISFYVFKQIKEMKRK